MKMFQYTDSGGQETFSADCNDASNDGGDNVPNPGCNTATVQAPAADPIIPIGGTVTPAETEPKTDATPAQIVNDCHPNCAVDASASSGRGGGENAAVDLA